MSDAPSLPAPAEQSRELTAKQAAFVRMMIGGARQTHAYMAAYSATEKVAGVNAVRLLKNPAVRRAIHDAVDGQMVGLKATATKVACDLLEGARSEKVKADMVRHVWDRTGLPAVRADRGALNDGVQINISIRSGHAGEGSGEAVTITAAAGRRPIIDAEATPGDPT